MATLAVLMSRRCGAEKVKSPPGAAAAAFPFQRFGSWLLALNARQPAAVVFVSGWGQCSTQPTSKEIPVSVRHSVRKLGVSGVWSVPLGARERAGRTTSLEQ